MDAGTDNGGEDHPIRYNNFLEESINYGGLDTKEIIFC